MMWVGRARGPGSLKHRHVVPSGVLCIEIASAPTVTPMPDSVQPLGMPLAGVSAGPAGKVESAVIPPKLATRLMPVVLAGAAVPAGVGMAALRAAPAAPAGDCSATPDRMGCTRIGPRPPGACRIRGCPRPLPQLQGSQELCGDQFDHPAIWEDADRRGRLHSQRSARRRSPGTGLLRDSARPRSPQLLRPAPRLRHQARRRSPPGRQPARRYPPRLPQRPNPIRPEHGMAHRHTAAA